MKIVNKSDLDKDTIDKLEDSAKKDLDKWEKGDFGKNKEFSKRASSKEESNINRAINTGRKDNLKSVHIKLPEDMIDDLKLIAEHDHMGYQTYLKQIAAKHIREWKKKNQSA